MPRAKHIARRERRRKHPFTLAGAQHLAGYLRGRGLIAKVRETSQGNAVVHVVDPEWEAPGKDLDCPAYTIA